MISSCLFVGEVVHIRRKPAKHRLAYKVFMGLFDLDELDALASASRLFGHNRLRLFGFYDADHGDGSGRPLRGQVEQSLSDAGLALPGGAIRILCMPRLMGYVFNPLSAYFCYDPAGKLCAVVHEVNNTFGERHFYALPANIGWDDKIRQQTDKQFRVSPFLPQDMHYRFTITPPAERISLHISVDQKGEQVLAAWFTGKKAPFSSASLFKQWLRHPAMTVKVMLAIHWEALFLWLKLRRATKAD